MAARREGFWQSFADLAMGVMAVVMLILLLVLNRQAQNEEHFREELRRALLQGQDIVEAQNRLAELIAELFLESDCPLRFDPATGRLMTGVDGAGAELYPKGSVRLSETGRNALRQCGMNLLTLVVCFDERRSSVQTCRTLLERLESPDQPGEAARRFAAFAELRGQVQSVVLEGNTDRIRYSSAPDIEDLDDELFTRDSVAALHEQYVTNAHLGSERARQAMGHLIQAVSTTANEQRVMSEDETMDALLHLLSIESPSFGKYLAGPPDRRKPGCDPAVDDCSEARNLSLRLRWQEQSLREPFDRILRFYCEQLERERLRGTIETTEGDLVICRGQ